MQSSQKTWREFVLPDTAPASALTAAGEPANRDSERDVMTPTPEFYRRLSQRRAALKRRTNFLERLLWLWR